MLDFFGKALLNNSEKSKLFVRRYAAAHHRSLDNAAAAGPVQQMRADSLVFRLHVSLFSLHNPLMDHTYKEKS